MAVRSLHVKLFQQNPAFCLLYGKCNDVCKTINCSTHSDAVRSDSQDWKLTPSPKEVETLKNKFKEPEDLVKRFYQKRPSVTANTESLYKRINLWNFKLTLHWPTSLTVCGSGHTADQARYNAYLQACCFFREMSMMRENPGEVLDCYDELLQIQCAERVKFFQKKDFDSKKLSQGKNVMWKCDLRGGFFDYTIVTSYGLTKAEAEENAACAMIIKLTAQKKLTLHRMGKLLPTMPAYLSLPASVGEDFRPDFTFYVDASQHGFGAYLMDAGQSETIRWISQEWPPEMRPVGWHTTFLEFYALFSVLYTWKKKFANCKVLAKSDSATVCTVINQGIRYKGPHDAFYKPYRTLQETCTKHNILFRAQYVKRTHNIEADLLSRQNINNFFYCMEDKMQNPSFISKRAKQLLFLQPFANQKSVVCSS